jgi:F420-0:gamma-glutamyl ligase-like protein
MAREEIFFGVNIDTGQPIKKFGELKDRTKLLKKELDGLKVGSKRFNEIKKEITANQATIRRFNRELRQTKSLATRVGQGVTNAFKGAGVAIAGAFAVSQITKFTSESIKLYDKQEKAVKKVEQAIKSTGKAAGLSLDELTKKASELQSKTIFGDEDILNNATAQLLTFTNITEENFLRTQEVALDLATVLDGDLKSASIQLGKALNDPVANLSALSRSGIQFSTEQKAVIKELATTNRLAEAQGVILKELERQYGGQAEAAAKAGAGGLQQLSNTFGDMQEAVGKLLFGSGKLVGFLKGMVEGFTDLITPTDEASQALIKQRLELNSLASRLNQTNQSQEDRVKLINEMNKVYPGFLDNLDAEKVTNEQIRDRLRDVNKELINKLTLQLQEEEVLQKAKDASELKLKLLDKQNKLSSKLVEINEQFGYSIDLVTLSTEEQIEALKTRLDAEADIIQVQGEKVGIENQQLRQLKALNIITNDYLRTQKDLIEIEEDVRKEQEKKQTIIDILFGGKDPNEVLEEVKEEVEKVGEETGKALGKGLKKGVQEEFDINQALSDIEGATPEGTEQEALNALSQIRTDALLEQSDREVQIELDKQQKIKEIEMKANNDRLQSMSSLLQGTLSILSRDEEARKKNAKLIKAVAIADIITNTQRALLNVDASGSSPLFLPNLLTGGAAGITIAQVQKAAILAQSAASVVAVASQKFQRGGVLKGASHANGGVPVKMANGGMVEAEGGEAIINKKSTAMFSPILSAINSYGGNGDKFERGGLLGTPSTTKIGDTTNAQLLGALNNVNFNPTVSVVEINEAQTRISELNTSSQL